MSAAANVVAGDWFPRWMATPMLKVATESRFGPWSYEIIDTKLARETRSGTILQLGLYSELLAQTQGRPPEYFFVEFSQLTCGCQAAVREQLSNGFKGLENAVWRFEENQRRLD